MLKKIKENIILSITGTLTFVIKLYNRTKLGRHDELFNDVIPKVRYLEIQHKIDSALRANQ